MSEHKAAYWCGKYHELEAENAELTAKVEEFQRELDSYRALDTELEARAGCDLTSMPEVIENLQREIDDLKASREGWQLVPIEPTEEMLKNVSLEETRQFVGKAIYKAMLAAAAPKP